MNKIMDGADGWVHEHTDESINAWMGWDGMKRGWNGMLWDERKML